MDLCQTCSAWALKTSLLLSPHKGIKLLLLTLGVPLDHFIFPSSSNPPKRNTGLATIRLTISRRQELVDSFPGIHISESAGDWRPTWPPEYKQLYKYLVWGGVCATFRGIDQCLNKWKSGPPYSGGSALRDVAWNPRVRRSQSNHCLQHRSKTRHKSSGSPGT
jgi:hypothetical protein